MVSKYNVKAIIAKRGYPSWLKAPMDDNGNSLDLYIATYPVVAKYVAARIGNSKKVFAELCCGLGISLIYYSNSFLKIFGVDINKTVLKYSEENLKASAADSSYGLSEAELICGDVSDEELLGKISNADIVAYDVPYWSDHDNDLDRKNPDLKELILKIRNLVTKDILIYAPTHYSFKEINKLLGPCEFQKVFVNGKHDRNLICFGALVKELGETEVHLEA